MSQARVVVVEDDPGIRRGVVDTLRFSGYDVIEAADGVSGLQVAGGPGVDLILLDLLLPRKDGLDVLKELRQALPARPVIVLTARGSEDDRVRGLTMGADDYVVKPFSARELLARVEAVLRRTRQSSVGIRALELGRGVVDLARREVRWSGDERNDLSETETHLLRFLAENRDKAVSREELLARIWGIDGTGLETRTIDMHIVRLRAKLRDPSGAMTPEAIVTVRSHGYMIGPNVRIRQEAP